MNAPSRPDPRTDPARHVTDDALGKLSQAFCWQARTRQVNDDLETRLGELDRCVWHVERDVPDLTCSFPIPFVLFGPTGVFVLEGSRGYWTNDDVASMSSSLGDRVGSAGLPKRGASGDRADRRSPGAATAFHRDWRGSLLGARRGLPAPMAAQLSRSRVHEGRCRSPARAGRPGGVGRAAPLVRTRGVRRIGREPPPTAALPIFDGDARD